MRLARVFPRITNATPADDLAFFGGPRRCDRDLPIEEVHVSVAWTWDMARAELIAEAWAKAGFVVKIGGPALGAPSGDFVPGRYLKPGYVITSRGCPNRCWFCSVWLREGGIRELPITEGFKVLDDNLLACSADHIRGVFAMLRRQKQPAILSGGLEAARLKPWHIDELVEMRVDRMYFAYDTSGDYEPLIEAGRLLRETRFTLHHLYAYVLIGYPGDTFAAAEKRLRDTYAAGFMPSAMLWSEHEHTDTEWERFQRAWNVSGLVRRHFKAGGRYLPQGRLTI